MWVTEQFAGEEKKKTFAGCGGGDSTRFWTHRLNLEAASPLFKCQNIPFLYNAEKSQKQHKNRAKLKRIQLDAETGCLWHKCVTTTFQLGSLLCGQSLRPAGGTAVCRHLAGVSQATGSTVQFGVGEFCAHRSPTCVSWRRERKKSAEAGPPYQTPGNIRAHSFPIEAGVGESQLSRVRVQTNVTDESCVCPAPLASASSSCLTHIQMVKVPGLRRHRYW